VTRRIQRLISLDGGQKTEIKVELGDDVALGDMNPYPYSKMIVSSQ
jgi:hypothetical protein